MTRFKESFCTSIAVAITISAHSISDERNLRTFRSISRLSHDFGSNEETVNSPSGGRADRLPSNGKAWRKLQYVSGNSGLSNRTFITHPSPQAETLPVFPKGIRLQFHPFLLLARTSPYFVHRLHGNRCALLTQGCR